MNRKLVNVKHPWWFSMRWRNISSDFSTFITSTLFFY